MTDSLERFLFPQIKLSDFGARKDKNMNFADAKNLERYRCWIKGAKLLKAPGSGKYLFLYRFMVLELYERCLGMDIHPFEAPFVQYIFSVCELRKLLSEILTVSCFMYLLVNARH